MTDPMTLEDWMDDLEDVAFLDYGYDVYKQIAFNPFKWEEKFNEGLTPEQALWVEFGT